MELGFIGLGAMGKPMAKRFLGGEHKLSVFDVTSEARAELAAGGAVDCSSPKDVAGRADIVFMSLPNSAIVTKVVTGEDGILTGLRKGAVVIDLSSVDPATSRTLAGAVEAAGGDYVDAPVSGGVSGAAAGTLTIMAGASLAVFEKCVPVLSLLGKKILHVGEVGAGDAVKIVNNLLLGANMAALAEALVLGRKLGLDSSVMYDVISQGSGKSYVVDAKMQNFIMKGNFQPGFAITLQAKDLGLALDAARGVEMPLPMTSQAVALYEEAMASGLGGEDISALVKKWEQLMDVEVRG